MHLGKLDVWHSAKMLSKSSLSSSVNSSSETSVTDLKNEPIYMLIGVKADSYGFNLLNTDVFDEEIILDIYNYCV